MSVVLRIGLTGKMRSGKDTVADYLAQSHGFHVPLSFGNALKRIAHETFPDVPKEPKPRELYQFMNVMREYDKDVWVKHLAKEVGIISRVPRGIVVTDARQPNEVAWLRDNGFTIVKVEADEVTRIERIKAQGESVDEEALRHKTESYVDGIDADYYLPNFGTINELHTRIDEMVAGLRKGEDG